MINYVLVLWSLVVAGGHALQCYSTDEVVTAREHLGHKKDCDFKWCVYTYSSKIETVRGCNNEGDLHCDQIGDRCEPHPNFDQSLNPGKSIVCCCNTDLCNASSIAKNNVILALFLALSVLPATFTFK
jgi:hypothetical protein